MVAKTMTINDRPKIAAESLPLATTALNTFNGFRKSFITKKFSLTNFAPSYVTDCPVKPINPEEDELICQIALSDSELTIFIKRRNHIFNRKSFTYPEGWTKKTHIMKREKKSTILTDTQVKNAVSEERRKKQQRRRQR